MKKHLIPVSKHSERNQFGPFLSQAGFAIPLTAITITALLTFVAIALDIGLGRMELHHLSVSADAGALAGVEKFRDQAACGMNSSTWSACKYQAIQEAEDVIASNGHSIQEIAAGGGITVGYWDPATLAFTSDALPYNAVQVNIRRSVPVNFAKLLGWEFLNPSFTSVAVLSGAASATCLVPFGISQALLVDRNFGDMINISMPSPGNWGKLDIGGNMSALPNFLDAMINGACSDSVEIGQWITPGTGTAGVSLGFEERMQRDPIVTMPVVAQFNNGNNPVQIVGFVVVELVSQGSDNPNSNSKGNSKGGGNNKNPSPGYPQNISGANWSGNVRFLNVGAGGTSGGPSFAPFALDRTLVQFN